MSFISIVLVAVCSALQCGIPEPQHGVYGAYMDYSTFTELTLNEDNTFSYVDQFELGGTARYEGKWKIKNNTLILNPNGSKNSQVRPLPCKWKVKGTELNSRKVYGTGGKPKPITLTLKK